MPTPGEDQQRRIGGRYRLSDQLGSGAMGTVWSGYDEVLQRRVAVKELKVPLGVPEREALAMRERMLREARALGGLSHPNVITVYDVVDVGGAPMVVLEMVPSRNLATMIAERGVLSTEQAAVVGYATAAALRAAHRSGITHRDVKPGNVLVADDGRVKLTDFGIARNAADAPMTTAGLVLGSPAYIAPEVAAGQPVRPAADLWGLGATLFAAIEGRPPYDVRGDPVSTITEVVDGEVPRPRGSGPVADVIAALMVKDPERRMPLEEVRRRLRPLITDPDDPLFPGSPDSPTLAAYPSAQSAQSAQPPTPAAPASGGRPPGPAIPLAPAPGPLPQPGRPAAAPPSWTGPPRPAAAPPRPSRSAGYPAVPRAQSQASAVAAVGLVVAGAVIVLLGTVGGWAVTRVLAGQSPLSTVTVTTARAERQLHTDATGFTMQVPVGWAEYRFESAGEAQAVSFVSPDGTEELTMAPATSAAAVTGGLTAPRLGADKVTVDPAKPVAGSAPGATELVYRTEEGSLRRTSWLRTLPAGASVWTVRLTVPGGRAESTAAALFDVLADGFTATGT